MYYYVQTALDLVWYIMPLNTTMPLPRSSPCPGYTVVAVWQPFGISVSSWTLSDLLGMMDGTC